MQVIVGSLILLFIPDLLLRCKNTIIFLVNSVPSLILFFVNMIYLSIYTIIVLVIEHFDTFAKAGLWARSL